MSCTPDNSHRIEHSGYNISSSNNKEANVLVTTMPYRILLEGNDEPLGTANLDSVRPTEGDYVRDFVVDGKLTPCFITRVNMHPELGRDEAGNDTLFNGTVWVHPESSYQ